MSSQKANSKGLFSVYTKEAMDNFHGFSFAKKDATGNPVALSISLVLIKYVRIEAFPWFSHLLSQELSVPQSSLSLVRLLAF